MRYFIGFLVTIGLIILLIVILAGGGKKAAVPLTSKELVSYANTDAEVRLTADGPINYDGSHRQAQIIVSQNTVIYNQIDGYSGRVVKGQSFPNNEAAYNNFLHALYHVGFTLGDQTKLLQDEKGYCPQGSRYIFELRQQGKSLERFWSTSCGKPKTYKGNTSATLDLFRAQIPNYEKISANSGSDNNGFSFF